jgi:endonuclease III
VTPPPRRRPTVTPAPPGPAWSPPPARRVRAVRARLRGVYGVPVMAPHGDPLGELVLTVLSQSTNDRNRDVAFLRLRERFPSWEAVRDAPVEEVEAAIQPGGLHVQKSRRIQEQLRALPDDLDLSRLRDAPLEEARAALTVLPGVGRKTAACVLLFAYGRRDVPVDTHVGRVATRLGLLRPRARSDELHDAMTALTPPGAELELHVNVLRHGRRTCHARTPACAACALRRMCPSRQA